ncbi:helix-turn-helix domain-containing protein [Paenibacillus bouchesdurhonensis]|uniref:helix-turn-helix domain-containing protein n=1 Tax=Paenibacillus bouchesdurhonensis TaxID=1870990 RepID=UPI000DA60425|nr:helix-turn-helix transcriptional regulator [Paenibacillus bouchesdurhonensis]
MAHYTKFGVEARKIMLERNIKMKDVAQEIGVSVSYVSDIFKGARYGEKQKPMIAKMLGMGEETKCLL